MKRKNLPAWQQVLLVALENHDLTTSFTAVAATLNNIGPGLSKVGPTQNFAFFSTPTKLVLIFDMLAGRLELLPMLLLFAPATWRKN
jgi:trk system potassium uptake protein TrkH